MASFGPETIDRLRSVLEAPVEGSQDPGRRAAAVLIPLFLDSGEVHVVLTKRSSAMRRHRGEISFPGGARDPGDASLVGTALREAHEEIGLDPADVAILGALDDTPTAVSLYVVRPMVALIPAGYRFVPHRGEVERILTPPLGWFAEAGRVRIELWEREGAEIPMPFFDVDGEVVWGATARMLVALLERLGSWPIPGTAPGAART